MRPAAACALMLALAAPAAVRGHAMPNSTVVLAVTPGAVALSARLPVSELALAAARPVTEAGRDALEAYLRDHVSVLGADGVAWALTIPQVRVEGGSHAQVAVEMRFTPRTPAGSPTATRLRYDAINHAVASHYVLIYRRDGAALSPLVRLQAPETSVGLQRWGGGGSTRPSR